VWRSIRKRGSQRLFSSPWTNGSMCRNWIMNNCHSNANIVMNTVTLPRTARRINRKCQQWKIVKKKLGTNQGASTSSIQTNPSTSRQLVPASLNQVIPSRSHSTDPTSPKNVAIMSTSTQISNPPISTNRYKVLSQPNVAISLEAPTSYVKEIMRLNLVSNPSWVSIVHHLKCRPF
jgi:hypothetical protein